MVKEFVDYFRSIANSHPMISSFKYEDYYEIEKTGEDNYPLLLLEDNTETIRFGMEKSYSLAFYIIELPSEDMLDYLDLKTKIEKIADEIVSRIMLSQNFTEVTATAAFYKDFMQDKTVAIRVEIEFIFDNQINICLAPWT